ncbi:anti-phage dCTP deaminase [Methylosinus sp. PW1]|uniref:anti-phage dCTP deaminase n=1 Tax=Methylosinus sp. PW1 TaxID=107636 RepID=UPI000A07B934|nr:anti-phage dCTP deaminase [Methylosinus sp. PW1]
MNDLLTDWPHASVAKLIDERHSQELVIALVGPVGSEVSTAAQYISDILTHDFKYKVCDTIKLSNIIKDEAWRVGVQKIPDFTSNDYLIVMQEAGNSLRKRFGGDYIVQKAIQKIVDFRRANGGYADGGTQQPRRFAYILDSLKNIEELQLLRTLYGESLCVFGIFAPDTTRKDRLINSGAPESAIDKIMDRDQGEVATFGQKTRKLFVDSDFFICNDRKKEELRSRVDRFLEIIFDVKIHTPTRAESAMYEAVAASVNSACMSRQVGAAIVSQDGELISVGWNDVPKFGGGLYREDDQNIVDTDKSTFSDKDSRCFNWGGAVCHNELKKSAIIEKMAKNIKDANIVKKNINIQKVKDLLGGTDIDSIIEFSRAIHAEMEAILAVAREGRHSLSRATLYTSTYPCHNCARHIVASGIAKVVYIEPYLKSRAIELHCDAITEDPDDRTHVVFRQYDGVAPKNYLKLFRPLVQRKSDGRLSPRHKKSAVPVMRVPLDSQTEHEEKVMADLRHKEGS